VPSVRGDEPAWRRTPTGKAAEHTVSVAGEAVHRRPLACAPVRWLYVPRVSAREHPGAHRLLPERPSRVDPSVGCRTVAQRDAVLDAPFPVYLFYPTRAPARPERLGPYELSVALDAPPEGGPLPLVVVSHGTGGSPLTHRCSRRTSRGTASWSRSPSTRATTATTPRSTPRSRPSCAARSE
jgi:hypothetical protein